MDDASDERFQHTKRSCAPWPLFWSSRTSSTTPRRLPCGTIAINHRLVDIHQDVKTTLARIETLLARMIERSDNGRDAEGFLCMNDWITSTTRVQALLQQPEEALDYAPDDAPINAPTPSSRRP